MATVFPLEAGGLAHFHDSQGDPLQGGKIYFYETGTTTPKTTYSESTGTTANANPVVLDSRGEAAIYLLGDQAYKMVVKDSDDVTLYTRDPVWGLLDILSLNSENTISLLAAETLPTTSDQVVIRDVSEGANNRITLDNIRTALPIRGYIAGLTLSNNGSDATNDIDIAAGEATDTSVACVMRLSSSLTKRLDAAWSVGTGNGGLDTGAIANDVYHVWLIRRSDTGVVDALFSTSATSPTMPTNYDQKRRIGSIVRSGGSILTFSQLGDEFLITPVNAFNVSNPGTSAVSQTISSLPDGIKVIAILNLSLINLTDGGDIQVLFSSLDQSDVVPSSTIFSLRHQATGAGTDQHDSGQFQIRTNTSGQIRYRANGTVDADVSIVGTLIGWLDYRDKHA